MSDRPTRLKWWLGCYRDVRFEFWRPGEYRCCHVNRFGIRCFRVRCYSPWCALHNYMCAYHETAGHKHVGR